MCFRVCRWLADIPKSEYWTGSRYPAKSTIFPPLATWKSWRGVWRELLRRIVELIQLTSEERRRPNLRANNIPPAAQLSLALTHPQAAAHDQPFHKKIRHHKFSSVMSE